MTRQGSYRRPQPPRIPLHAAPAGQRQRVLRLFIAAGTGAAGLCLVIGSVALVASAGGRPRSTTVTSASHLSPARPSPARLSPARLSPARTAHGGSTPGLHGPRLSSAHGRTILSSAGRGAGTSRRFTISGTGTWQLKWSYYDCSAQGGKGEFVVTETGTVPGASLSEFGTAGHGTAWAYRDKGSHHLVIRSECAWRIAVVGQQ